MKFPEGGLIEKIERSPMIEAVRRGLVMSIPLLMTGSFALIFNSLPIPVWQWFLKHFLGGALSDIACYIHTASFGIISIYMTISVSTSYGRMVSQDHAVRYGAPLTSAVCFALLSGAFSATPSLSVFGVKGMFTALICAVCGSAAYAWIYRAARRRVKVFADGADELFNTAMAILMPASIVITAAAVIDYAVIHLFSVSSFHEFFIMCSMALFSGARRTFFSGLLYVLLASFLWFFGIHGSNVLEEVSLSLFAPAIELNRAIMRSGGVPNEILTKTFFDTFVLMGGCGASLALLIAIIVFSKRSSCRNLARYAAFPMLFNINEIMVFGFPIVLNPTIFVPFLLTPLACYVTAYAAMAFGLVPVTSSEVAWTTPVFIGGWTSTGSIRGALLQAVNLCIGVAIYRPFVLMYDRAKLRNSGVWLKELVKVLQEHEENHTPIKLTELSDDRGTVAKMLAEDLETAVDSGKISIYYQPQFDNKNACVGAEALLRWKHPHYGMIYPPLVIKLADEKGILIKLEESIVEHAARDIPQIHRRIGANIPVSVNVSGGIIQTPEFEAFMKRLMDEGRVKPGEMHVEVTEQMALATDADSKERLLRIRDMGYPMEIDDFSMGHTSIKYLQSSEFSTIKLDGSIVRDMLVNPRSMEIIASIVSLSHSLGFHVIAEYVDNEAIRAELEKTGCTQYQGYLFSPAVPLEELGENRHGTQHNSQSNHS